MGIEDFGAEGAIESFDVSILSRLSGLYMMEFHSLLSAPVDELLRNKLRSIVDSDLFRESSAFLELLKNTDDSQCRKRSVNFDRKSFTNSFIDDVECPKATTSVKRAMNKVH